MNSGAATVQLTKAIIERQDSGEPVHKWEDISVKHVSIAKQADYTLEKIMQTDVFALYENIPLALAKSIMLWEKNPAFTYRKVLMVNSLD